MDIRSKIQAKKLAERSALISKFSNADEVIKKGISQEQFDDKYGSGYNVFTPEALEQFKADAIEKGDDSGIILAELENLDKVDVLEKGEVTTLFVERIEEVEEATEEEE